jgi:hypothetical protein
MKLALNEPGMKPFEAARDLKVFVACENPAAAAQACDVLDRIGRNIEADGRLIYNWWNFEVLAIPSLKPLAGAEAAEADLIIVAAHDGSKVPKEIIDWLNSQLSMGTCRCRALVALLDSHGIRKTASLETLAPLKKIAKLCRIDFYAKGSVEELEAVLARGMCHRPANRRAIRVRARRGLPGGADLTRQKYPAHPKRAIP